MWKQQNKEKDCEQEQFVAIGAMEEEEDKVEEPVKFACDDKVLL